MSAASRMESLWTSGEIWRAAAQARDAEDLAFRLGMGRHALERGLGTLRRHGHHVPHLTTILLQAKRLGHVDPAVSRHVVDARGDLASPIADQLLEPTNLVADEWDEPTNPGVPSIHQEPEVVDTGVPFQQHTPPGFHVKGLSTLFDADGNPRSQWVKSNRDQEDQFAAFIQAVKTIAEPFTGAHDPIPAPGFFDDDLLCVYPFGDPHFGLYSWMQETGEAFDLDIAERVTVGAIDHLVRVAPAAKHALVLSVGDTFHADGYDNRTQSGHALDVDTRWSKVLSVVVRAMRRSIDRALEKHEHVTFWSLPGNHDPQTAVALAVCLAQYYEREPRVFIDTSPSKFMWYRFGKNLIGATHGDKAKPHQMAAVMACDRAKDWGETTCRVIFSGHLHHDKTQEFPGVIVETLRTLAAKDAWHAAMGYRSGRDMKCDVFHRMHGRISRHAVNVTQLLEAA